MVDVLRVVSFVAGAAGIGFGLVIVWPYAWSLRRPGRKPLAWHVVGVSVSWMLLAGNAMLGTLSRLGGPFVWSFLLRTPGLLIGLAAMVAMLRHLVVTAKRDDRKLRALRTQVDVIRRQSA